MSMYNVGDKVLVNHATIDGLRETVTITAVDEERGNEFYWAGKRGLFPQDIWCISNPVSDNSREQPSVSSTGGAKNVKPEKFSLIPTQALAKVAEHYGVGAEKYAAHQWRQGYEWSKSYDALQRHANAFWAGEDNDPETKTPHMAAVAFHALTLLTFMEEHPNHDDRYKEQK